MFFWTSRASTPEWTRLICGRLITSRAPYGWVSTASPLLPEGLKIGISEGSGSPARVRAPSTRSCHAKLPREISGRLGALDCYLTLSRSAS